MSADPHDTLRFILAQHQQQHQQQHGRDAQLSTNRQLNQLYQHLAALSPALNAAAQRPPSSPDPLSRLVANYLQDASLKAAAPASNHGMNSSPKALALAALGIVNIGTPSVSDSAPIHRQLSTPHINHGAPSVSSHSSIHQQQQELFQAAKLLATNNPGLAAAAMEQALAMGVQSHHEQWNQAQQKVLPLMLEPQCRQQLFSYAPASSQANFVTRMCTDALSDNINGIGEAPENEFHIDFATKSKTFSQRDKSDDAKNPVKEPLVSLSARLPTQSRGNDNCRVATSSTSNSSGFVGTSRKPKLMVSSSISLPTKPLSLLTLQTWSLEQLETHVKMLQDCKQPIPNTVRIALENARNKESKKHAQRMANRKSASTSRARKKLLIDELTAANARLQRQALILSCLPDPVVVIGTDGEIKFCSVPFQRMLRHKVDDLLGSSIEEIIVPDSRQAIRQLIQTTLVEAEQRVIAAQAEGLQQNQANGGADDSCSHIFGRSRDFCDHTNATSLPLEESIPLAEVNLGSTHDDGALKSASNSLSDPSIKKSHNTIINQSQATMSLLTHNSSSLTSDSTTSEDKEQPLSKKAKSSGDIKKNHSEDCTSSNQFELSNSRAINIDDVMGSSVTSNNADARLSSLMHDCRDQTNETDVTFKLPPARKQKQPCADTKLDVSSLATSKSSDKQEDTLSLSAVSSTPAASSRFTSSEDSGYMLSSSDGSLISRNGLRLNKKRKKHRPLAPACNVCLIRNDLTAVWCELTCSIHIRARNDEDIELGIIDLNPKPAPDTQVEEPYEHEKELMLCFRQILERENDGEVYTPSKKTKAINDDENSSTDLKAARVEN